jgi:hypothetical protein
MSVFTNPAGSTTEQNTAYTDGLLSLLGAQDPIEVLGRTPAALRVAVSGLATELLLMPESNGKWSVTEVLQHLADAELVNGFRLRMILAHDRPPLVGYDQDSWAQRLGYRSAHAETAMNDFETLRRGNLRLLESLAPDDWRRVGVHAERGVESIERLFRLVAGHDLLHLRQIARILAAVSTRRPQETGRKP